MRKWGGTTEDYIPIHDWFDQSKMIVADFRHRALRHHAEGIFMLERFLRDNDHALHRPGRAGAADRRTACPEKTSASSRASPTGSARSARNLGWAGPNRSIARSNPFATD